jgi:hypothetical protein
METIMSRYCWTLAVVLLMLSVAGMQAQIPRVLSYQGMLLGSNKQPVADAQYALTFKLYDETSSVVWTEVQNQVPVGGGMFLAMLGSVTPLSIPFDKAYTLGIQVGSDPEMQPRMPLNSVAYAIRAEEANRLLGYSLRPTPEPNMLLPLDSTGKFPASVISGGTGSGDFIKKNVPDSSRGTSTSPIVLFSNLGSGNGVDARSASGVGLAGRSTSNDGVTGWTGTSGKSGVYGYTTEGAGVTGRSDKGNGVVGWTGAAASGVFGHTSNDTGTGVHGLATSSKGVGVWGFNNVSGNFAKLGTETHGLDVKGLARFVLPSGQISISTPGGWPGIISYSDNGHRRDVIVWDGGMSFEISNSSGAPPAENGLTILENGSVGIGTTTPGAKLEVTGAVKCASLTLTGGSDLAEPFDIKKSETVKAGMVMVIDPNNPGELKVADRAYDSRVAGVISGAGGILPGMLMSQTGSAADGKFPVALTGRVYCLADVSGGSIKPGDLLTTSDTPGHAMKVTDYSRAQGAILGKAMSALDHEKGLVLILVTLQ